MLKDSWHWGRDSSVVDDLIGEPDCTPLYVGLLSALGSGIGASLFRRALLGEPGGIQEGSGDGHLFPWGPHWGNWKTAHMLGLMCGRRFWDRCLSI